MKILWLLQYWILFEFSMAFAASKSYYTIIAPGTIKSNLKYPVVITLHNADEACAMRVGIEGPSFNQVKDVFVHPFESKLVEFMPQKLSSGEYKLKAEGISGLSFRNESTLLVMPDYGPNIYIQTDKAIYKPNDLVQFRIVILDEHTRPLKIKEPIRIEILDDLDNRVKQFKDISLIKGVYTGYFQLSEHPVMGVWKIKVIISGKYAHSESKTIKVQKYVLPKFSVHVKSPAYILLGASLKVGVYGKYTYDKYVAGQAIIELWNTANDKLVEMKQIEIETIGYVEFNFEKSLDFASFYSLQIEVKFTENLTGIQQNEKRFVRVVKQNYNIKIPSEEIEFLDNKPYRLRAHVQHWSRAPVLDHLTPVIMKHGKKQYKSYLDDFGVATFNFDYQPTANYVFTYKDSQMNLPYILLYKSFNETEYYCRLRLVGGNPRLGNPVEIEVSSIENLSYFVYTIMAHGTMVRMELVKVPSRQKSYIIRLTPSIEMIPTSFIYVHYVHNGNLRFEELELEFPREFENQVSLVAPKEVGPGKEVTIEINAEPNSYVSILAVDLSVYLLNSDYDLKKHEILHRLLNDLSYTTEGETLSPGVISGVITLTNAYYPFSSAYNFPSSRPSMDIPPTFRNRFPETWIFQNLEIQKSKTQLTLQIPDTITSWRITAFSNHDIKGFGIVNEPTDIITIQPFFITLNLPYSVKRGEILAIPVILFNYSNQSLDAQIIIYNQHQEFNFIESNLQEVQKSEDNQKQFKQVHVPSDEAKIVTFYINPIKLDEITLKIAATSSVYSDAIEQKLKVEPEGVVKQQNKVIYMSVPTGETFSSFFFIVFPEERVPDSEYITLSVGGDYLVPTLENFHDLVQLPTGCGEQNMVHFAPNILLLQYLKVNGKLSKEREFVNKLRSYIDTGYQQQLSFRHKNGGYSVFGESSDAEPSNWLTAYVVRYLIKSGKHSPTEARIIEADLNYLASQQNSDGAFPRSGYLFSPTHQNKYGLTAFVLLTFLEDRKYAAKYQNTIQKGLEYLNSNLNNINDIYALSIVACALKIAKHTNANSVVDKLKQRSKTDSKGLMWWSGNNRNTASDVEITGYSLMALLDTPGDHTPILKWLIQQRNAQGGFKSTQDTVVGLEALVKFSEKHKNINNVNLTIKYRARDSEAVDLHYDEFKVDPDNALILQQHALPKLTRYISFEAKGFGHSLMQLSYQYNIVEKDQFRYFLIQPKAKKLNINELYLEICITYQEASAYQNTTTNMVVMELNLPSGFRSDAESDFDIEDNELIQRIESKNSDSTIIFYFDSLLANVKNCLNIAADKIGDVINPKPAAIIVYDYYNLSRSNTEFYTVPN